MKFAWAALRRRKVVRATIGYLMGAWVLMQVGDILFGLLAFPGWAGKVLVVVLLLALRLVIFLAWAFDDYPCASNTGFARYAVRWVSSARNVRMSRSWRFELPYLTGSQATALPGPF